MKGKENPSLILAFHGMLGRKKQTSLLLILLTMVFSFLTAATIYSGSSAQALQDTRCELYGEWQYLRLSDTDTDAAQVRDNLPASAKVSTAIQDGIDRLQNALFACIHRHSACLLFAWLFLFSTPCS